MSIQHAPAPAQARPIAAAAAGLVNKHAAALERANASLMKTVADNEGGRDLDPTPPDEIGARPPCDGGRVPGPAPVVAPGSAGGFGAIARDVDDLKRMERDGENIVEIRNEGARRLNRHVRAANNAYTAARFVTLVMFVLECIEVVRPSTLRVFAYLCWHYVAGQAWNPNWHRVGHELALSPRTMRRAREQLERLEFIVFLDDGRMIIRMVEAQMPPGERAHPLTADQLHFRFACIPASVEKWLNRAGAPQ